MPNPNPKQSQTFLKKRFQRQQIEESCIPASAVLAEKTISTRYPASVDKAIRAMGKKKAAWIREVVSKAALEQGLIDEIE